MGHTPITRVSCWHIAKIIEDGDVCLAKNIETEEDRVTMSVVNMWRGWEVKELHHVEERREGKLWER